MVKILPAEIIWDGRDGRATPLSTQAKVYCDPLKVKVTYRWENADIGTEENMLAKYIADSKVFISYLLDGISNFNIIDGVLMGGTMILRAWKFTLRHIHIFLV